MIIIYDFILIWIVFHVNGITGTAEDQFGYSNTEQRHWYHKHADCAGRNQSPISISSYKATPIAMPAIEMVGYHNLLNGPLQMHNNGQSVSIIVPKPDTKKITIPYIFGGKLIDAYEFEGLHFHWGDRNSRGSEHVLNGIRYPLEMHIVHRNKKYNNTSEALTHSDGLCVLAFLYSLTETDSPQLANIEENLIRVKNFNDSYLLNATFSISSLLGNSNFERFYMYEGSLTTPPCSEAVMWVIFSNTLPVSVMQLDKFRQLSSRPDGTVLVDNYRRLQPLRNRQIFVRQINEQNLKMLKVFPNIDYSKFKWI